MSGICIYFVYLTMQIVFEKILCESSVSKINLNGFKSSQ